MLYIRLLDFVGDIARLFIVNEVVGEEEYRGSIEVSISQDGISDLEGYIREG